jgi:hypothetical protein
MVAEDLDVVCGWLKARTDSNLSTDILPKHGYIIDNECACFVYSVDNAPVCFVEWVVTNPDLSARAAYGAVDKLAKGLSDFASTCAKRGVRVLTVLSKPKLAKIFNKHGFVTGCTNETSLCFGGA